MTVRNIKKNLAGAEDLLHGIGLEYQVRGGAVYDMHKLDTYVPTYDIAEMQKSSLTFMRLYGDDTHYTDYRRNPAGTVGIPSDLGGVWEPIKTSELQVVGNSLYGAYVYDVDQVMCHNSARYSWSGSFPKVVSAGSTPVTSGGIGAGAWVDRTDVTLRSELNSSILQRMPISKNISDIIYDLTSRKAIYADEYGVSNSETIDSADALQGILLAYPEHTIMLPPKFALSHSIKYPANCDIRGLEMDHCVCYMLTGFESDYGAAFEPVSTSPAAVQYSRISKITFVDKSAVSDGAGTTSVLNGVELLGTYVARCTDLKGVNVNAIVHCLPPPVLGVHQYTKRPILKNFDCSNVNYLFDFEPTADGYFSCGDIFVSDIFTSGSMKYGARALDTDGFTWTGSTMFPDAQLQVSGNYISVAVCHPFEAKAKLTDATHTAECFVIKERAAGQKSNFVNLSLISGFSGRQTDDYVATVATNKVANGISMYNVSCFTLTGAINDPSAIGLYMRGCDNGTFDIAIRSANSPDVGQVHEPVGTWDSVLLVACEAVIGKVSDKSTAKRYAVYMDEDCTGCHVDIVTDKGTLPTVSNVRIPSNGQNSYTSLVKQVDGKYKRFTSHDGQKSVIVESSNSTTPSCSFGRSGAIVRFDNSAVTTITDIPDLQEYDEITLHIQDDGATRFAPIAQGGKFVFIDGSNTVKLGRGTMLKVMRCPTTGNLVQI